MPVPLADLSTAFSTAPLVQTYIKLAPFILGVACVLVAISLVKWGIRKVAHSISDYRGNLEAKRERYPGEFKNLASALDISVDDVKRDPDDARFSEAVL